MQKLPTETQNKVTQNRDKITALFPNCLTERKNKEGEIEHVIDFDKLKQELSDYVVEGPNTGEGERYQFTWPDKKKSILLANAPISKTLRPCREESVNFDTTENLYIEGDNLDVLKILQETYLNKVKMIYIDPPYNTGNDFVYEDDFAQSLDEYKEISGDYDEEGNRLFKNTDSNGRFHTDWLNMIYPRLKVAKDLLAEDGVIFISIDDNEVHNLRKVCDEVFGEVNFIGLMTIQSNPRGSQASRHLSSVHEYLLMYAKKSSSLQLKGVSKSEDNINEYSEIDKNGQKYRFLGLRQRGGAWKKEDRPLMHYPIYVNPIDGHVALEPDENFYVEVIPQRPTGELSRWTWGKEKFLAEINKVVGKQVNRVGVDNAWDIFRKDYLLDDNGKEKTAKIKTIWNEKEINYQNAKNELKELFSTSEVFDFPKPTYIVKQLLSMLFTSSQDIILDFFSGSATTAHAVMQLNAEDNGNRKFIMVQVPELTYTGKEEEYTDNQGEKQKRFVMDKETGYPEIQKDHEARKAGYYTIPQLAKERIRRAGTKIKEENPLTTQDLDIGFRVLKVDSSNMKEEIHKRPVTITQADLFEQEDNIKEERTAEDLLFQAMLQLGVLPSYKIEEDVIAGKKVFTVNYPSLIACFDENVTEEVITEIAKRKPFYFVMRDSSMASDSLAVNFDNIFKQYSDETKRLVI